MQWSGPLVNPRHVRGPWDSVAALAKSRGRISIYGLPFFTLDIMDLGVMEDQKIGLEGLFNITETLIVG